jgi:hypothetical protein
VSSTGRVATIGPATVDDGADESSMAGVSADTGLSRCDITDTATDTRAKPVSSAIQPAHPAAERMRPRIWRTRNAGFGRDGGAALPCHSHSPGSRLSLLMALESRGHPSAEWGAAEATGMTVRPLSNPRAHLSRRPSRCSARRNVFARYSRSVGDCSSRNAGSCSSRDKQAGVGL